MKYYVYLIISINNQKSTTYVGYTSNLKNRLLLHNTSKGAKFTRGRKWVLIYKKKYESKSVAMKNEYILKNDRIKRKHIKNRFLKKIK
jgi:putative endonuclease